MRETCTSDFQNGAVQGVSRAYGPTLTALLRAQDLNPFNGQRHVQPSVSFGGGVLGPSKERVLEVLNPNQGNQV